MIINPEKGTLKLFRASGEPAHIYDDEIVSTLTTVLHRGLTKKELKAIDPDGTIRKQLKLGPMFDGTRGGFSGRYSQTGQPRYGYGIPLDAPDPKMASAPVKDVEIPLHLVPALSKIVELRVSVLDDLYLPTEAGRLATRLTTA